MSIQSASAICGKSEPSKGLPHIHSRDSVFPRAAYFFDGPRNGKNLAMDCKTIEQVIITDPAKSAQVMALSRWFMSRVVPTQHEVHTTTSNPLAAEKRKGGLFMEPLRR